MFSQRYGQADLTLRGYVPLHPRLTLAMRGVFDALFGDPPFYELTRFADTYAIGGVSGVRGVPGQRYGGKLKAFGNVEVRADIVRFRWLDRPLLLSSAAFFDAGRVWADGSNRPDLDGSGIGIKWGVGAGPLLQSGEAFVLRAEIAWSPDARPIGGYFTAGQLF
jgi:outer membrane protein assembly factor BamA